MDTPNKRQRMMRLAIEPLSKEPGVKVVVQDDTPRIWQWPGLKVEDDPPFLPGMTQTMHSTTYYMRPQKFDPAVPLTGLALRLLAVSNAFHECGSSRIA